MNIRCILQRMALYLLLLLLMATAAIADQPFNPSRPATRDEVMKHFLGATYGGFFWTGGFERYPFYPNGFPNWKMDVIKVKELLGEPEYHGKVFGFETLNYDNFEIMIKDNRFIGVRSGTYSHQFITDRIGAGDSTWQRLSKVSLDPYRSKSNEKELAVFSTRFATHSSSNTKYTVIAWLNESGDDKGSYVMLKEIAKNIINLP